MGADLCGYILVGPPRLSAKRLALAKKSLAALSAKARQMFDEDKNSEEQVQKAFPLVDLDNLGYDGEAVLLRLIAADEQLLDNFTELWNSGGGGHDSMSRLYRGRKILVAAEVTYGDGPAEGGAWWLAETLGALGLLAVLGIA